MINPAQNLLNEIPEIKFYNKLHDETQDINNRDHYLNNCNVCYSSNYIKRYARKLISNYYELKAHINENSYNKYCRFFLYWLYRAKLQFYQTMYNRHNNWKNCITCVWKNLEENANNHTGKCDFKNEDISFAFIKVKKALDEICSIKDKLTNNNEKNPDPEKCLHINSIKKYYLDDLLSNIGSISSNSSWNDAYFKIDSDCSLDKIYKYLSENQCSPKEIIQTLGSEECRTPAPEIKQDCTKESCHNLEELCQKQCTKQQGEDLDELGQERCTSHKPPNLEQLCPTYCAQHPKAPVPTSEEQQGNPPKIPHLQIPVTVFSSVVGTIFFFLFLYKFTPFRSWFLNRIGSKNTLKHKMKQEMDREFLGAPFHPPYVDDQNSRPRVGYSQN
ncbi:PIR protein [Plasmodium vivax]|uniref:VIR protein n=1 Tax=Plasmodium vivax TaxID=5855 RepID=A0A565A6E1_PLAVI|nr:PIR protein [Plasmodium vivax]